MPKIFLAPSSQEYNPYISGGNEEFFMNLIADEMEPFLRASGIDFVRNNPGMTAAQNVAEANRGDYDLYFSIHSNASPEGYEGRMRGPEVYYFSGSGAGRLAALINANGIRCIYPKPELVSIVPSGTLVELRGTKMVSIVVEIAYHDNAEDARWILTNMDEIAKFLVLGIANFLGTSFGVPVQA